MSKWEDKVLPLNVSTKTKKKGKFRSNIFE